MQGDDGPVVNAAVTSFRVLEAVQDLDGAGVSEIARYTDRSKSGVYKHVNTLERLGYLTRRGDTYELAIGLWALGADVRERLMIGDGRQTLDSLAASIDHSVSLLVYEDGRAVYAYQDCSPSVERRIGDVGDAVPLHATAAGKAVLAYLPPDRFETVVERSGLEALTDHTTTDPAALRAELETVRGRRIAVEREERVTGLRSIAAPILAEPRRPFGAIGVSATDEELEGTDLESDVTSVVVNASRSVENSIE